jgi:hypothetical protein
MITPASILTSLPTDPARGRRPVGGHSAPRFSPRPPGRPRLFLLDGYGPRVGSTDLDIPRRRLGRRLSITAAEAVEKDNLGLAWADRFEGQGPGPSGAHRLGVLGGGLPLVVDELDHLGIALLLELPSVAERRILVDRDREAVGYLRLDCAGGDPVGGRVLLAAAGSGEKEDCDERRDKTLDASRADRSASAARAQVLEAAYL